MVSLDRTMTTLALPQISYEVGATAATRLVSIYQLSSGAFLVVAGRLNDLFGLRKMLILGTLVFTLSSLLCALTASPELLVFVRGVQALGGAAITVAPTSLIIYSFADSAPRARAISIANAVGWVAQGLGPFVGGSVITLTHGWHRIFLINLPIGLLLAFLASVTIPVASHRVSEGSRNITDALSLLVVTLLGGYGITGLGDATTTFLRELPVLTVAGLMALQFALMDARADTPFIPFKLFREQSFKRLSIASALLGASVYTSYLVYPSYLQIALKYSPLDSAWALLPLSVIPAIIAGFASHRIIAFLGLPRANALGLFLIAAGLLTLLRAPIGGNFLIDALPSMLLVGAGLGVAPVSLFLTAMEGMPQRSSGAAAGLYTTCYVVGSGLGVTVQTAASSLFITYILHSEGHSPQAVIGANQVALALGALFALVAIAVAASVSRK